MALLRSTSNAELLRTLYERHRTQVFVWAARFGGGSRAFAEDITHDVFLKLFDRVGDLDATEDLGGWLYRVTANLSLRRLRRDRSFAARLVQWVQPQVAPANDQLFEFREDVAAAVAAINALPPKERVVMSMLWVDGLRQAEIATALGMSKGNVSKLVARSRARLQAEGWSGLGPEDG